MSVENQCEPVDHSCFERDFSTEAKLLADIRRALIEPTSEISIPDGLSFPYNPEIGTTFITLFQLGTSPIRWGSSRGSLVASLIRDIEKIREHARFGEFDPADPQMCRILLEIITRQWPIAIGKVTLNHFNDHRFEPGITGFKFRYEDQPHFYMPTDAVTRSHMTLKHALNDMAKKCGIAKETTRISERAKLMKSRPIAYWMIKSVAFVTDGSAEDTLLPLYRGYPMPVREATPEILIKAFRSGVEWVLENMDDEGKFLYYYEGIKDTDVDHVHPKMVNPTYYNILRHSGGTISLLRAYELFKETQYLKAARKSIDCLLATCREHDVDGRRAVYTFFNRKSKLGGTGIGLAALMHYVRLTGDTRDRETIEGMVCHLLSRVDEAGEMIGYYIHPKFNNGRPILDPDDETKRALFSFYYPGEALQGLALYCLHFPNADPEFINEIKAKSRKALNFLIQIRPKKYPDLFTALPSDGWLMQAIEEWSRFPEFRDDSYKHFVYTDADAMLTNMYTDENSPFADYPGGFFYDYGDHAYSDGARCEGLIAAYFLARRMDDEIHAERYKKGCYRAAKHLLYTANTRKSLYAHRFPEKSLGSFRFKLTRQWVRIDSVQHTACFYARLAGDLE